MSKPKQFPVEDELALTPDVSHILSEDESPSLGEPDGGRGPDRTEPAAPDDPFGEVEYENNFERDAKKEMSALLQAFKVKAQREDKRFHTAVDSEFWFAVCFETREAKEAFLQAMGWLAHGDKYLDGHRIAEQQGVKLPASEFGIPKLKGADKSLATLPTL